MKKISMLEFRLNTEKIIKQVQSGQSLILTRRGNPVARIEPIIQETQDPIDPFFLLSGIGKVASLSNAAMDGIIYDKWYFSWYQRFLSLSYKRRQHPRGSWKHFNWCKKTKTQVRYDWLYFRWNSNTAESTGVRPFVAKLFHHARTITSMQDRMDWSRPFFFNPSLLP